MNAECLLFGHRWFWRHAIRARMCSRCLYIDLPLDSQHGARASAVGSPPRPAATHRSRLVLAAELATTAGTTG